MTSPTNQQLAYTGLSFVYFSKYRAVPNSKVRKAADSFVACCTRWFWKRKSVCCRKSRILMTWHLALNGPARIQNCTGGTGDPDQGRNNSTLEKGLKQTEEETNLFSLCGRIMDIFLTGTSRLIYSVKHSLHALTIRPTMLPCAAETAFSPPLPSTGATFTPETKQSLFPLLVF